MIRQRIYIERYDWWVTVYYAKSCYHTGEIVDELVRLGCYGSELATAYRNLRDCSLDTGLTYSNGRMRETVMVIGLASSCEEYENSIAHERQHLVSHICETLGVDPESEECAYLVGDVAMKQHGASHALTCGCRGRR